MKFSILPENPTYQLVERYTTDNIFPNNPQNISGFVYYSNSVFDLKKFYFTGELNETFFHQEFSDTGYFIPGPHCGIINAPYEKIHAVSIRKEIARYHYNVDSDRDMAMIYSTDMYRQLQDYFNEKPFEILSCTLKECLYYQSNEVSLSEDKDGHAILKMKNMEMKKIFKPSRMIVEFDGKRMFFE